jgi:hypothetical protein
MTPSKVTAWLECPHYLTLRGQVDHGLIAEPQPTFGSFARLRADKGLSHEQHCLDEYRRQGKSVFEVPPRHERESFAAWVDRVSNPFADSWDVVYQMPFVHDEIRGIADFVVLPAYPTEWVYGLTATSPGRRLGILSRAARWSRPSPKVRRGLHSTVGGLW